MYTYVCARVGNTSGHKGDTPAILDTLLNKQHAHTLTFYSTQGIETTASTSSGDAAHHQFIKDNPG
jgi:hypothetical protein